MKRLLFINLLISLFIPLRVIAERKFNFKETSYEISEDLLPLLDLLKNKGFVIKFEIPPRKNVYGLFEVKNKTIWISPKSFLDGIARQTILHEATHAAQSCPNNFLTTIDLELPTSPLIKKEIQAILLRNYNSKQFLIEKEAYYIQTQKNAIDLLLKALKERCR